jgi:tRNA(fMet)-specific endonuclease VapC
VTNYLLDTNHLSPLVTIGHPLRQQILDHLEKGETFSIAAPALNEFLYGIGILPRAVHNLKEWERLNKDFNVYAIDRLDAEESAKLRLALRQRGWQLGIIDSFIAVIALRYDLTLLTTDQDFVAIPNLQQKNWRIPRAITQEFKAKL